MIQNVEAPLNKSIIKNSERERERDGCGVHPQSKEGIKPKSIQEVKGLSEEAGEIHSSDWRRNSSHDDQIQDSPQHWAS